MQPLYYKKNILKIIFFLDIWYEYKWYELPLIFALHTYVVGWLIIEIILKIITIGVEAPGAEQYIFQSFHYGVITTLSYIILMLIIYFFRKYRVMDL